MADALRIFHINMHLGWGGQPNRVLTTAAGLRARGHHVCVAGPKGAMLNERARAAGFEVFDDLELRRGFRPVSMARDVSALAAHFRAARYDVLDTHGSQDTWACAFALPRVPAPRPAFVRTRHNTFPVARHPLNKWLYRRIDHVVTISPQVIPLMEGLLPVECFTPIYSAPDPARFQIADAREDVRRELGCAEGDELVGVVARLAPEKGHAVLIDAIPAILEKRPRARFVFIGKGRSQPAISEQLARMNLTEKVQLLGFRTDVPRLLKALDLFCLPPIDGESLGTSILEAFLMEVPVVATDVGGVSESVRDGITGRLVPHSNPPALAEAIVDQLSHADRAKAWARAGKALVESEFTPEMIGEKTEAVYRTAIARARTR